jgi:cellulose synthase/poly-beta-1,6-N-acetylglucosamine synthase-like glycosyltransferase
MDLVSFWLVVISLILFVAYAFLIAYYKNGWNKCPEFESPTHFHPTLKVSVIIPARNEEDNIKACLMSLQHQSYPAHLYEILVVDDHSEDKTAEVVSRFPLSNLKLISLKDYLRGETNAYKKKAIEVAIQQAGGEWIITTDADCVAPVDWIWNIMAFQESQQLEFVAAPVKIIAKEKLLDIFQVLDFMTLQGITGGAVYRNLHVMCNGANLAYSRRAFQEVNGFKDIDGLASGDDMFLMQKIRIRFPGKAGYLKNKNAIVITEAAETWKAFWQQRIRWSSKADKYQDKKIFRALLLVYAFNFFLLVLFIGSIFYPDTLFIAILLLLSKTLVEFPFVRSVAKFFNQEKLMFYFAFLQPFHIIYVVVAGFIGKFGTYQWKGRKVK